jgi:hypothetical protein
VWRAEASSTMELCCACAPRSNPDEPIVCFCSLRALFFPGRVPIVFAPASQHHPHPHVCAARASIVRSGKASAPFSRLPLGLSSGACHLACFFPPLLAHIKDTKAPNKKTTNTSSARSTKELFPSSRHGSPSYTRIWLLHASVEEKSSSDYN